MNWTLISICCSKNIQKSAICRFCCNILKLSLCCFMTCFSFSIVPMSCNIASRSKENEHMKKYWLKNSNHANTTDISNIWKIFGKYWIFRSCKFRFKTFPLVNYKANSEENLNWFHWLFNASMKSFNSINFLWKLIKSLSFQAKLPKPSKFIFLKHLLDFVWFYLTKFQFHSNFRRLARYRCATPNSINFTR